MVTCLSSTRTSFVKLWKGSEDVKSKSEPCEQISSNCSLVLMTETFVDVLIHERCFADAKEQTR